MSDFNRQVIHSLHWWTDTLFSLTCSRSAAFEFESGQFVRIRSAKYNQRLSGRYGIVSPSDCNELEFLCTRTPTEGHKRRLEHLVPEDEVLVGVILILMHFAGVAAPRRGEGLRNGPIKTSQLIKHFLSGLFPLLEHLRRASPRGAGASRRVVHGVWR